MAVLQLADFRLYFFLLVFHCDLILLSVTVQNIHRYHMPCFRQEPFHACQVMPLQNRLSFPGFGAGKPLADRNDPAFQ